MELIIWILIAAAGILLIVAGVKAWERKKKRDAEKEEADRKAMASARTRAALAMGSMGPAAGSSAGAGGQSRPYRSYGSGVAPQTAQPTVVHQNSGMDPLMAGIIGYGLAGGFSSKSHGDNPGTPSAPMESCKPEERSYDSGGNSDSGSSYDSGSSSDSSSSSDSGGGDSGGGGGGGD